MTKLRAVFLLAIAVSAAVAGVWISRRLPVLANPVFLTTSSPKQTYRVRLSGRSKQPSLPIVVNTVYFSVEKQSQSFLADKYVHSGDWFDPSYNHLYPQHDWAGENVLHLYDAEDFADGSPSKIVVRNSSPEAIKYLRVTAGDTHLLLDLEPGSQTELKIPSTRGDLEYVVVEGEFSSSKPIENVGQNFFVNHEPSTFYIDVAGTTPTIESPHRQKYQSKS